MQSALHAATMMLPDLRRGLSEETAARAAPRLLTLTEAAAVALADRELVLAWDGAGADHHTRGHPLAELVGAGRDDRVHVESSIACDTPGLSARCGDRRAARRRRHAGRHARRDVRAQPAPVP